MMFYKNMKAMVRSPDRDTDFFKILQGISFHTQREDGANTSSILFLQAIDHMEIRPDR